MAEDAGQAQAAEALLREAAGLYEQDEKDCQQLLADAGVLYERHQAGRAPLFNVFSVLRSESDEVNLHSRFLAALLDYRKAPDKPRANLEDFLQTVAEHGDFKSDEAKKRFCEAIASGFDVARVERERDNIDILISNSAGQAVVIENKIWAGDQHRQLQRYHENLEKRGFEDRNIHVLYLTPHGHEPSDDSKGKLEVVCISYDNTLPPWLERCQERAYAEPGLRESIAQYLNLVRKLTGTDWTEEYMEALKDLSVKGNNPRLIHDLGEALINAKIGLLVLLWEDIECALEERIGRQPREKRLVVDIGRDITGYVTRQKGYTDFGLYWPLQGCPAGTSLAAAMLLEGILIGIRLSKDEYPAEYAKLGEIARNRGMEDNKWGWYPCSKLVDSDLLPENFNRDHLAHHRWEHVEFLNDGNRRKALATRHCRRPETALGRGSREIVRLNAPACPPPA